jgi:hypothetical protein
MLGRTQREEFELERGTVLNSSIASSNVENTAFTQSRTAAIATTKKTHRSTQTHQLKKLLLERGNGKGTSGCACGGWRGFETEASPPWLVSFAQPTLHFGHGRGNQGDWRGC